MTKYFNEVKTVEEQGNGTEHFKQGKEVGHSYL